MTAKSNSKPKRYAVYFSESQNSDRVLLEKVLEGLSADRRVSDLLRALIMRGWLHMVHGLSPEERSLQFRALELPDDLIREIDATIPSPAFLGLSQGVLPKTGEAESKVTPAPAASSSSGMNVPDDSKIGKVSALGGLS